MSSVPNSYIDDLRSIVLATLNRIEQLRMRVLFGVDIIKGSYGQELQFKSDGKVYIDDVEVGAGGVSDHGALTGLADDDHTQYMPVSASRNFTGDVTIHKANPNLILYPTTTDSPRFQLKDNSNNLKSSIYQNTDDMAVVCEDGILYLATRVTTGGNIKFESKAVTQLEISNTGITASVPLAMGANKISGLATPSLNGDAVRYEHLADDDHTQYLPTSASRALTGDLYINKTTPHLVLQEGGTLRGSLYIESDDSTVLDAATDDLTLASASHNINLFPAGTVQAKFTPTEFVSYQDVVCDKTSLPGFVLYEGANYRGGIYINSGDDTVVDSEHGDVVLGTYASTGGLIKFQPKAGGNAFTIDSGGITAYQNFSMDGNAITNAVIAGINNTSFIIDQDNAGAGVSSSLRFNRGSTDGDAAIWWDETDDEFQFESDVGVTVGSILIDECRHGGSVKTSRNPSTGDYEIEVASGDSIVFKAV